MAERVWANERPHPGLTGTRRILATQIPGDKNPITSRSTSTITRKRSFVEAAVAAANAARLAFCLTAANLPSMNTVLTIRLPDARRKALQRRATAANKSESVLVRELIEREMQAGFDFERVRRLISSVASGSGHRPRGSWREQLRERNWRPWSVACWTPGRSWLARPREPEHTGLAGFIGELQGQRWFWIGTHEESNNFKFEPPPAASAFSFPLSAFPPTFSFPRSAILI